MNLLMLILIFDIFFVCWFPTFETCFRWKQPVFPEVQGSGDACCQRAEWDGGRRH